MVKPVEARGELDQPWGRDVGHTLGSLGARRPAARGWVQRLALPCSVAPSLRGALAAQGDAGAEGGGLWPCE